MFCYLCNYPHTLGGMPLVLDTFLKCGKLQCKSTFNRKWVCLLMIEHIEANQIVDRPGVAGAVLQTPSSLIH